MMSVDNPMEAAFMVHLAQPSYDKHLHKDQGGGHGCSGEGNRFNP